MMRAALVLLSFVSLALASPSAWQVHQNVFDPQQRLEEHIGHGNDHDHDHGREVPEDGYVPFPLAGADLLQEGAAIPGDGEPTADSIFSGIGTFAHLPLVDCFKGKTPFDIAFMGAPFDTGTSYRPGARFGPSGIRQGSRRLTLYGGYNVPLDVNPFRDWARVVDCGDVPVTPYDNVYAIKQIEDGHRKLLHTPAASTAKELISSMRTDSHGQAYLKKPKSLAIDGKVHPRVITMGGDHTIVLPILRSIHSAYGPISVIHFDSHLDTWEPKVFGGRKSDTAALNHGTYFWHAAREGLIKNGTSVHAGIRTTLSGPSDYKVDKDCGFALSEAREIDQIGTQGIIDKIRSTVGDNPVYLSIDIDVLDPSAAPATGTPETGGWSTRELRTIIRGLEGLNIVSADIVEVAPPYDTQAELTQMAAADVLYEVMSLFVLKGPLVKS